MVKKKHKVNKTNKKKIEKIEKKDYFSYYLIGSILLAIIILIIFKGGEGATKNMIEDYSNDVNVDINKLEAEGNIVMYFFHLERCPHCIEQRKFHKELKEKYPNLKILMYELSDPQSNSLFEKSIEQFNFTAEEKSRIGTPFTIIGNQYNIGFGTADTTGKKIEEMVEKEMVEKSTQE